jgi:hypothetical protein
MNWLEWLGALEIIQLAIIFGMCGLFWLYGNRLRGGKKDETDSRYCVHGVVGPDPYDACFGPTVATGAECSERKLQKFRNGIMGMECGCEDPVDPTVDKLASRRSEPKGEPDPGGVRAIHPWAGRSDAILNYDPRERLGLPYPAVAPLDRIDQLRERADTERAKRRARQTDTGGVVNEPDVPNRTVRSTLEGTKAGRPLGVDKPHGNRGEG